MPDKKLQTPPFGAEQQNEHLFQLTAILLSKSAKRKPTDVPKLVTEAKALRDTIYFQINLQNSTLGVPMKKAAKKPSRKNNGPIF